MKNKFVHLHTHTEYSLLDGATRLGDVFSYADSLGQNAIAITDHGNMFGVLEFCKQAVKFTDPNADFYEFMAERREFKVKPIVGCEFYVCPDIKVKEQAESGKAPKLNHLVLLAKDIQGYKNLIKLVSLSYTEGFYYKPRIDFSLLEKNAKGLICFSACLGGEVPSLLLKGEFTLAKDRAEKYKALFGDDYYIEIQDHNMLDQKRILPALVKIANDLKIKLVATNDIHYLRKEDWKTQKVLQNISFRKSFPPQELDVPEDTRIYQDGTQSGDEDYFPTREFYLKSEVEMLQLFSELEDAVYNTAEIADKCEPYFFTKKQLLPKYISEKDETSPEALKRLTYEGLSKKYAKITPEIKKRADYELELIVALGFSDYFLIVYDFINYAEKNNIPVGPGRGSGVGSIVAYALSITKLDPLKYGLMFERFLNPDRVSNPDFDIDFCVDRRDEVIEYVKNKYTASSVSQIITFGSLKAKAALKDVGRVFEYPYSEMDKITKLFPSLYTGSLKDIIGISEKPKGSIVYDLKELYQNSPDIQRIFDMAIAIENMPRQTGIHAAGVIICRDPIYKHIPQAVAKNEKTGEFVPTTQFDMVECEELGLLKMDFLGLRTLTDIHMALQLIEKNTGKKIDFYNMDFTDPLVFEMISQGDTHAVFQLESEGMKRFMRDLRPTCFEDIIAGVALFRPGPMDNIPQYVLGKNSGRQIIYAHKLLEPILNVTYGVMVYQEQVIKAAQQLAGYSAPAGDELRAMISKKKTHLFEKERKVFLFGNAKRKIVGCVKNGVDEDTGNKIFDDIIKFGNYAFNKSHAAAYAHLAYQTAYLKRHHTVEFITAVLNNRIADASEVSNYLNYLKHSDIKVLPPCINKSIAQFSCEGNSVRIGLVAIKNVGYSVIDRIIIERQKNGEFLSFDDFICRMYDIKEKALNKRMLEALILSGTFDTLNSNRAQLMQVYDQILAVTQKDAEAKAHGQISLFDVFSDPSLEKTKIEYPAVKDFSLSQRLKYEKESAGVYLSGHPLDEYREFLKGFTHTTKHFETAKKAIAGEEGGESELSDSQKISLGGLLVDTQKRFTRRGSELGIGRLEDLDGSIEFLVSGNALARVRADFVADTLVTISGRVGINDEGVTLWVDDIKPFSTTNRTVKGKNICFYLDKTDEKLLSNLQEILLAYKGVDNSYIKSTHDNQIYNLEIPCDISDSLLLEVDGLLGEGRYKIVG